jgi:predicted Zn-dependent protease
MLVTQSYETKIGTEAFQQFLADSKVVVVTATPDHERVSQVFTHLTNVAKQSTYADLAKSLPWEIVLLRDDFKANSVSFPGGKVGVYTGLLAFAETDDELAGVLGHNIASILARHGGEQASRSFAKTLGDILALAAEGALSGSTNPPTLSQELPERLDPKLVALLQEEADRIGLLLAADAGYAPDKAFNMWVKVWGPGTRLDALRKHLPEARERFRRTDIMPPTTAR